MMDIILAFWHVKIDVNFMLIFSGMDFNHFYDVPLVFYAGSRIGTRVCMNVTINEDALVEGDELFSISLEPIGHVVIYPDDTKEITIVNDDCENFFFFFYCTCIIFAIFTYSHRC